MAGLGLFLSISQSITEVCSSGDVFMERESDGGLLANLSKGNVFPKRGLGWVCFCRRGAGDAPDPRLFQFSPRFLALFCSPVWKYRRLDPDGVKTNTIFEGDTLQSALV